MASGGDLGIPSASSFNDSTHVDVLDVCIAPPKQGIYKCYLFQHVHI